MTSEPASATTSHPPRKGRKYFTLAQANSALRYVSRVVADIMARYHATLELRQRLERPNVEDDAEQLRGQYEQSMDHLSELVDELRVVGVELKDFEKGLVDFPAVHEGREVFLCWHWGEDKVQTWHEIDAGYAGRQDVALLKQTPDDRP